MQEYKLFFVYEKKYMCPLSKELINFAVIDEFGDVYD